MSAAPSPNPPALAPQGSPSRPAVETLLAELARRTRRDGGAQARRDSTELSVEATVWLALALRLALGPADERCRAACAAVARVQGPDGRVSVSDLHPGAYSPTSIAILAWHGARELAPARRSAVAFLLAHGGDHFPSSPESPIGLDTDLAGWPWIDRTFSWTEPTALALLALESAGEGDHARAREGRTLLLDRQIRSGGWNYGNREVFGSELRPAPESTGLALAALAGRTPATAVAKSLDYLERLAPELRTPLALGWATLARVAWGPGRKRAEEVERAMRETLARESRYGGYETADLALLAVAAIAAASGHHLVSALEAGP
jgi:hypothetical protein